MIVEEPPPEEAYRKKTFEEQTALLSLEDRDTLTRNLQGYAVFPLVSRPSAVTQQPVQQFLHRSVMTIGACFP